MRFIYTLNNVLEHISKDENVMTEIEPIEKSKKIIEFEGGNLEGFYLVKGDEILFSVTLTTPLGNMNLGSVNVNPSHKKAVISGGNEGYKAKIYLELKNLRLVLNGMICIPFYGCKMGNVDVNLNAN